MVSLSDMVQKRVFMLYIYNMWHLTKLNVSTTRTRLTAPARFRRITVVTISAFLTPEASVARFALAHELGGRSVDSTRVGEVVVTIDRGTLAWLTVGAVVPWLTLLT